MTMHQERRDEVAARLRELRQSYGYETAASFARAIGYDVARYQRCERSFPYYSDDMTKLGLAIMRVGPVSFDWLLFGKPEWAGQLFARAGLRVRNGVSAQKATDAYWRENERAWLKHEERLAGEASS